MIDDRLKAILAGVLDVDADGIGDEFSSADTPSWDSIGMLRLVTAIEEAFGIHFAMDEIARMTDYATIRRMVLSKAGGGAP